MSDEKPAIKVATAVAESLSERFKRVADGKLPDPEPTGECVHCGRALERVAVYQQRKMSEIHFRPAHMMQPREPLFVFYGCSNELCRHMFWQPPQKPSQSGPQH